MSYITPKEYNSITKMYCNNKENYRPLIYDLIDFEISNFNNLLFELITSCVSYNPNKRPSAKEIINVIYQLETLSFNKNIYDVNSANVSKQNSYNESFNIVNNKFKVKTKDCIKESYLEKIRTRNNFKDESFNESKFFL